MINSPITGQYSLSKISGKREGQNAILTANSRVLEYKLEKCRGVTKGPQDKTHKMENRSEYRAEPDNGRLKEFSYLVRKDGIKAQCCQHKGAGFNVGSRAIALRANSGRS